MSRQHTIPYVAGGLIALALHAILLLIPVDTAVSNAGTLSLQQPELQRTKLFIRSAVPETPFEPDPPHPPDTAPVPKVTKKPQEVPPEEPFLEPQKENLEKTQPELPVSGATMEPDSETESLAFGPGAVTSTETGIHTGDISWASGHASAPATGSATPEPLLTPSEPLNKIQPQYPRAARQRGIEGLVKIRARVDAAGIVKEAWVAESSGSALLDTAALEAVKRSLFSPAFKNGIPVQSDIILPIRFQLK